MAPRCPDHVCIPFDPSRTPLPPAFFRKYVKLACGAAGGARESRQGVAVDFLLRKARPRARAFWTIRPRCAFLWCAHRPAAPLSTRTHQSRCSPVLEPTRRRHVDDVRVLVLRRDVRAHARRTLPLHAEGAAAARRGQRRRAAVARSGPVDRGAAGGAWARSGSSVRPLARALFRSRGFAAR